LDMVYFNIYNRSGVDHECNIQMDGQTDSTAFTNSVL